MKTFFLLTIQIIPNGGNSLNEWVSGVIYVIIDIIPFDIP